MKKLTHQAELLLELLRSRGPLTRKEIARITGIHDRDIQDRAREIDLAGEATVGHSRSGKGGYYLTDDIDEIGNLAARLESRSRRSIQRAQALRIRQARLRGNLPDPEDIQARIEYEDRRDPNDRDPLDEFTRGSRLP